MKTSLMLKGNGGKIEGYVLQHENSICYSVKGLGESGKLFLLTRDGIEEGIEICCDAQERKAQSKSRDIIGAVVTIEEAIYAYSGKTEKEAFEKQVRLPSKQEKKQDEKPEESRKNEGAQCVYKKEESSLTQADLLRKAHRRWPPPPCWTAACYVGGVWREENEE